MKDHFIIGSGDLSAVVLAPESPDYARTRFNHSAFIPDVIFKNVHFGQPEQVDPAKPTTKGAGLCCELICPDAEKSVSVGEEYVKPGIGYVRRVEKPWFFTDNPPYRPFETSVSAQSDRILFVTETEEVGGIAYRECRLLKAEGNTLSLSVHFENLGEKPLDMLEFCHNFISLGVLQTGFYLWRTEKLSRTRIRQTSLITHSLTVPKTSWARFFLTNPVTTSLSFT